MKERDIIRIVFRVAVLSIIFFDFFPYISANVRELIIMSQYMQNIVGMIEIIIVGFLLPFILAILFWNRSEWIAEKILGHLENSTPSKISQTSFIGKTNDLNGDRVESII